MICPLDTHTQQPKAADTKATGRFRGHPGRLRGQPGRFRGQPCLEAGLHQLEQLLLHLFANHCGLVDEREPIADCSCLPQSIAPPDGTLLQGLEAAISHWDDAIQLSLHSTQ